MRMMLLCNKSDVGRMPDMRRGKAISNADAAYMKAVGQAVADLRKGCSLTQAELAERLGVDPSTVTKQETGDTGFVAGLSPTGGAASSTISRSMIVQCK